MGGSGTARSRPRLTRRSESNDRGGRRWHGRLVNLALYEVGWFACVLAVADGRPALALAAVLLSAAAHVFMAVERSPEVALMMIAAVVGAVVDSATVRLGALRFAAPLGPAGVAPLWVVGMWAQFAILFHFCLDWLSGRYWLSVPLGAVGGPLSFLAGARLGAVDLVPPVGRSLAILAVFWALALPILLVSSDRLRPRVGRSGRYRFEREASM